MKGPSVTGKASIFDIYFLKIKGAGGQPSELPGPGQRSCSLDPLLHC